MVDYMDFFNCYVMGIVQMLTGLSLLEQEEHLLDRYVEEVKVRYEQIRSAYGDENKVKELERKLGQVENELKRKDNDTYRRQNTSFSEKR